jgi:enoyl-[acyl-carrier-protein] reductase (NADH)
MTKVENTRAWAIVLGATGAAGEAIVRAMLARGLHVLGFHRGRHPEVAAGLLDAAARYEAEGRRLVLLERDAAKIEAIPNLVQELGATVGDEGKVGVFVHALADASVVSVLARGDRPGIHPKQVWKSMDVMAHSFLFWGQALHAAGRFAPFAQVWSLHNEPELGTFPGAAAIASSKGALGQYVRYMAAEMASSGVRVNGLRFGAVPSRASSAIASMDRALNHLASINPMGRTVTPDDVAGFLALLHDERAGFLNGAIVDLDGGEHHALLTLLAR